MSTVEKILVEQKTKGVQVDGRACNRRLNQNGLGGSHVCGRFPLFTSRRQRSWIFGLADVH